MAWNPDLSYGMSSSKFGHQDYTGALKEIWNQGGADRQQKLIQRRKDVLAWLGDEANVDKIAAQNRRGASGGLYSDISSGDLTWKHQGHAIGMQPNEEGELVNTAPQSANWIGHADLYAGRAAGHSWSDIKNWLDQNPDRLRGNNPAGKGGLYDEVATEARIEGIQGTHHQQTSDLVTQFGNQMSSILESQQTYQQDQQDWQKEQAELQRAHEAAMLAEQRKVRTATPTHVKNPVSQLAIGPGKVAAPQSASSLARKRLGTAPLVTGLNIGTKKNSMHIK